MCVISHRRILRLHCADSQTVVDLFGRIKHFFPILSSIRKCHQLAQYRLSLRIRNCISVRYLNRPYQAATDLVSSGLPYGPCTEVPRLLSLLLPY
jgi:hypothetical protein